MDYFLVRQQGSISIPNVLLKETKPSPSDSMEPSVRIMESGSSCKEIHHPSADAFAELDRFDYIANEHLLSERLKDLIEQYLPEQFWRPCVFVDLKRKEQKTFWFLPTLPYAPKRVDMAPNGIPDAIYIEACDFAKSSPGIFCVRNRNGASFLIVHLSVAESILRRGICGLKLERI